MELPPKPEYIHNLEFVRILTPYVYTRHFASGKSVLDVGCGLGHGTWLLIQGGAERVIAIDLSEVRVRQVAGLFANFQAFGAFVMDAQKMGFKDHSFQLVTCFEVLEHVPKPDMLLSELRRILKVDGVLLLTTPNRAVRLLPLQPPWNPEHFREYTLKSLRRSLQKHFPSFALLGIYGEPEPYGYYRRLWQQSPFHVYFGWALRIVACTAPAQVRVWIRNQLGRSYSARSPNSDAELSNIAVPALDPESWPFYVSNVSEHCLNFLAICGFAERIVQRAVGEIKRSACRWSQS